MANNELNSLLHGMQAGSTASRIARVIGEHGSLSAAQVARLTGLARSTVSVALTELKRSGIVVDAPQAAAEAKGVGRPATALTLNPDAGTCVGVHLSLEEISLVIADVSHSIIFEQTIEVERDYSPQWTARMVRDTIHAAYRRHGLSLSGLLGVGVAVSGPVSPGGIVQRASILPTWAGVNVPEVFAEAFDSPVFADNESNCAALAELMWGVAAGEDDFVLFKIDIAVGGAVVHDGRVITGIAGGAGEFGHIGIDPDGPLCRCGNRGCLEITASFMRPLAHLCALHGRRIDIVEAIALAKGGDVGARRLIADTAEQAGRGLGIIATILNPPLIVVAGRLALAGDLLLEPLAAAYEKHTLIKSREMSPETRTRLVIGRLTANDALLGAIGLVLRRHTLSPAGYEPFRGSSRQAAARV